VNTTLDEDLCHRSIQALVRNTELEKIYKERLLKMRREGTLLGVKPKPYSPASSASESPSSPVPTPPTAP
jgi:hypothetical protein